jgi:hypothetical protein
MDKLHIITVATHDDGYYQALLQSAKNNNTNITTLGWGQKWKGFTMKTNLIIEYISSFDENDIVVVIDAYDVIMLDNEENIKKKFYSFNKPILLSRDGDPKNVFATWFQKRVFKTCSGHKINAGMYMGYVWAIKKLLDRLCKNKNMPCTSSETDDQMLLINVCNNKVFYETHIAVDSNKLIFYNTYGNSNLFSLFQDFEFVDSNNVIDNKLYLEDTKTYPSFIHGPANTNLNSICKLYKLPILKENNRGVLYRIKVYAKSHYFKYLIDDILYYIGGIILIVILVIYYNKLKLNHKL